MKMILCLGILTEDPVDATANLEWEKLNEQIKEHNLEDVLSQKNRYSCFF